MASSCSSVSSADSQASRKDELQAALKNGIFDAGGHSLLQRNGCCCALDHCVWANFEPNGNPPSIGAERRCFACGFASHQHCFRGFDPNSKMKVNVDWLPDLPLKRVGYCLDCLLTQREVLVPSMGEYLVDDSWPTISTIFKSQKRMAKLEFCSPQDYEAAIKNQVGRQEKEDDDYDDKKGEDESEEDQSGNEPNTEDEESDWEDVEDDDEEDEYPGESSSEEDEGKKRYVKFQDGYFLAPQ